MSEVNDTAPTEIRKSTHHRFVDLENQSFGQWTVFRFAGMNEKGAATWDCRCKCGETRIFVGWRLTSKRQLPAACVCSRWEAMSRRRRTHGESKTRLYRVWGDIHSRCYDPSSTAYKYYGGRGITMCEEWKTSYVAFRDWALVNGYADNLTIERKKVDLGYDPSNCCFITQREQTRNTRRNVFVEAFGETKTVSEWVDDPRCLVVYSALYHRLKKGWDAERAISSPSSKGNEIS